MVPVSNTRITDVQVLCLSFFVLLPLGFTLLLYFPQELSPDIQTYLGLAQGEWNQSAVRRYRLIIPLLAGTLDGIFHPILDRLQPWTFNGDFSLSVCFLLVNAGLMSCVAWIIFKIGRLYPLNPMALTVLLLSFYSNRWTLEIAALPLIDSLYLIAIVTALYGRLSGNEAWLRFSIFLGPWAKESYLFMLPFILLDERRLVYRRIPYLLASGLLVFGFRAVWDFLNGYSWTASLAEDFSSLQTLPESLHRLFSFHGLYELLSVAGLWSLLMVYALLKHKKTFLSLVSLKGTQVYWIYLPMVLVQALLSGDLGRMFYLAIPVVALVTGIAFQSIFGYTKQNEQIQNFQNTN